MKELTRSQYLSTGITELRIHGAGATPLPEMLDSESYVRVAGDETAGFYRVPKEDRVGDPEDPRYNSHWVVDKDGKKVGEVEAYTWGKFSTGGGWRAGWALLLPFALVNLAGWIAPRQSGFQRAIVRLIGLATSVALVYWLAAISIGILSECGPDSLCAERKWYLGIANWPFISGQSRLAIVGIGLSVLATFALWWWPGRRTTDQYERYRPPENSTTDGQTETGQDADAAPGTGGRTAAAQLGTDAEKLWHFETATHRWLAAAHVLAMLSAIAAGAFTAVGKTSVLSPYGDASIYVISLPRQGVAQIVIVVALFALAASAVFVAWFDPLRGHVPGTKGAWRLVGPSPGVAAWVVGGTLVLAAVWWLAVSETQTVAAIEHLGRTPLRIAYQLYANSGLSVLGGLIVLLFLILFVSNLFRGRRSAKRLLAGLGPTLGSAAALFILAALVSGGVLWVADVFGQLSYQVPDVDRLEAITESAAQGFEDLRSVRIENGISPEELETLRSAIDSIGRLRDMQGDLGAPLIRLGSEYYLMPLGFTFLVLLMALLALGIFVLAKLRIPSGRYEFPDLLEDNRIDPDLVAAVEKARGKDEKGKDLFKTQVATLLRKPYRNRRLHWLFVPPIFLLVGFIALLFAFNFVNELARRIDWALTVSIWFTVAVFLVLGLSIRDNYAGGVSRGSMGGIWDILTFWPRFYHPFAPPSYGIRAVPELAHRITHLTRGNDDRLVVSAHSQGVPITVAALTLVPDSAITKTALITYGSPTGLLYGRYYPDYYSADQLQTLAQTRLRSEGGPVRWSNLWRLTDWTGGYALKIDANRFFPKDKPDAYLAYLELFTQKKPPTVTGSEPLADVVSEFRLTDTDPMKIWDSDVVLSPVDPLPAPKGHGEYLRDRLYPDYRATLLAELLVTAAATAPSEPPGED